MLFVIYCVMAYCLYLCVRFFSVIVNVLVCYLFMRCLRASVVYCDVACLCVGYDCMCFVRVRCVCRLFVTCCVLLCGLVLFFCAFPHTNLFGGMHH